MTITIADGRGELWQWDTGRRVKITDGNGVKQIHYQNKCFGRSVDVDVGDDGTAIIPDELLQDWHTLTAYAYVTDDTGAYTMVQQDFAVHKRAKPSGYVYTPTDQMTLQAIQRQIGDLADLTTEAKDTLVAAINEAARSGGGSGSMDLRVADGYIQYSTDGGSTWANLIAVAELKGTDGAPGARGEKGDKGDTGAKGDPGATGADGITPHIGDNGNWYLGENDTGKPSRGATGAKGDTGAPGKDGAGMDITGATVGQIAKITAVDSDGKPTAWSPVDMPSGGDNEANFQLVFNQECLLDVDVSAYEVDIDFGLQDFKEFIALIEYSASTNVVYQTVITIDGVTIDNYGGPTLKGFVMRRVIYAERTTQTEYIGIHRANSLGFDWQGGNTPSTLSYFSNRIAGSTRKLKIYRSNSAEATTIAIKLYKR